MLSEKVEQALNQQVQLEAASSQHYLSMASWAEVNGYNGIADFMYAHSDEEREHMLKLVKYINERGGHALVQQLAAPPKSWTGLSDVFQDLLDHEVAVSAAINDLIDVCLTQKDYTTQNFLQWYVAEQIEEEALARTIMDKLNLIGNDKGGLYLFDRDISTLIVSSAAAPNV